MSKGLIILTSGILLLIGTLIWIYRDNKTKVIREQELLKKIDESSSNVKIASSISIDDKTEMIDDSTVILEASTELLYNDSTELLDDTDIICEL